MTACPGNGHQALPTHGSGCPRAVAEHAPYTVHRHRVPRELDQPPGGAGLRLGPRVGAGWETDCEVVRGRRVLAEVGDGGDDLGELIWVFEVGRKKPSWRAARRSGLLLPGNPATHTGTPGRCTGRGRN